MLGSPSSLAKPRHWATTAGLASLIVASGCSGPYSALDPAGPSAQASAALWWGMFTVSALVMALVYLLWWYAMQRQPSTPRKEQRERRAKTFFIIGGGIILPSAAITVLLAFGIPAGHRMFALPVVDRQVLRIEVEGQRWFWRVRYPDHDIELINEIHIPVDTPVDFHIRSADVIHGFWVPRLGGKMDAIPGRTNVLRLEASQPGVYGGQCAEFCGLNHAHMHFELTAHERQSFADWLTEHQHESSAP